MQRVFARYEADVRVDTHVRALRFDHRGDTSRRAPTIVLICIPLLVTKAAHKGSDQ